MYEFEPKKWFIYRKRNPHGIYIEIKRDKPMLFPWIFGWKLIQVVDYEIIRKKKH